MKKIFFSIISLLVAGAIAAQKYPEPEFRNEICLLKKDSSVWMAMRLEKGSSKMDSKVKAAGFGGSESSYTMEGERSTVRLNSGKGLSFIISTGASGSSSAKNDSMMRANGVDPSMMSTMMDPSSTITLYKTDPGKGNRKIILQKSPGMFGGKKMISSDKYTLSIKKIKEGYWELVVDKTLPKGEYAFTMMGFGMGNMDGSLSLFAFAVE
jgi:hypothetical protein